LLIVTYSSINCFRNCHKRYYWEYDQCLVPKKEAWPLLDGRALHYALEAYHGGYRSQGPLGDKTSPPQSNAQREAYMGTILNIIDTFYGKLGSQEQYENIYEEHKAMIRAMVKGYAVIHPPDEFEEYIPEAKFRIELENPLFGEEYGKDKRFILAGKTDARIMTKERQKYLFETKTTSENSITKYLERLTLDSQPDCYLLSDPSVVGVIYNIIRKPKLKQAAFESNEKFFRRFEKVMLSDAQLPEEARKYYFRETIYRSPEELSAFKIELNQIVLDMSQYLPYKNPARCMDFNGCPYIRLDEGYEVGSEFRKKGASHEELTQ